MSMNVHNREFTVKAEERHYAVREIMELWGLSRRTVTRLFENEPGVLVLGHAETRTKRRHLTLRIPQSVMERVWRKNTAA